MEHKKSGKKRIIVLSVVLLVILGGVGGAMYAWHQLNRPDVASLTTGRVTNSANNYDIDLTPVPQTGQYVSFEYPKGMTPRAAETDAAQLEAYTYVAKDVQSWLLAISVSNLPAGNIADSSDYMLRKNNPSTYAQSEETLGGQTFIIMTDRTAGGFSEVAFVQHGSLLASISLTGDHATGLQPLQTTFDMVLSSWKWAA